MTPNKDEKMKKGSGKAIGWKTRIAMPLAMVLMAFLIGYWLRGGDARDTPSDPLAPATVEQEEKEGRLAYVCPMMCVPPMEKPGHCPICGMDLTPVPAAGTAQEAGPPRMRLSEEAAKLAAIQVATVERRFVSAEIRLFGQMDYDPAHITNITAFTPGVIDRVYVRRAGQFVRWGDPLFDMYSSDLLSAQQQLVEAMRFVPGFLAFQSGAPHVARDTPVQVRKGTQESGERSPEAEAALEKIRAIRHKLTILGMPKRDVDELMKAGEATGLATVYAPMYGQVIEQNAFEGTYVNTGTPIMTLGDPQYVWARLDAYEADYPWLRNGQKVSFQTDAYPGETFEGEVIYIDPVFRPKTRTFAVGLIFQDRGGRMKAGMLVRAVIHARLGHEGRVVKRGEAGEKPPLVIPASAPLITGKRAIVYVAVKGQQGVFEGREIVLGPRAKDHYLVMSGLKQGEKVVVNGNFKLDSAVQILAKSSMMDIQGGHSATAHHTHGGSQAMAEDYSAERLKSRLRSLQAPGDLEDETSPEVEARQRLGSETRTREPSTIHRRKPGMYGDSIRPKPPALGQ